MDLRVRAKRVKMVEILATRILEAKTLGVDLDKTKITQRPNLVFVVWLLITRQITADTHIRHAISVVKLVIWVAHARRIQPTSPNGQHFPTIPKAVRALGKERMGKRAKTCLHSARD